MNIRTRILTAEKQLNRMKSLCEKDGGGGKEHNQEIKRMEETIKRLKDSVAKSEKIPRAPKNGPGSEFTTKNIFKVEIYHKIVDYVRDNNMTQSQLCGMLALDPATVCRLCNGNLTMFKVDRMLDWAEGLGIVANIKFDD